MFREKRSHDGILGDAKGILTDLGIQNYLNKNLNQIHLVKKLTNTILLSRLTQKMTIL